MTVEIIGVTTNTVTGYDIGAGTATPEVSTNLPLDGVLIVRLSATDDNYGINMIEFSYDVEAPFTRLDDIERHFPNSNAIKIWDVNGTASQTLYWNTNGWIYGVVE